MPSGLRRIEQKWFECKGPIQAPGRIATLLATRASSRRSASGPLLWASSGWPPPLPDNLNNLADEKIMEEIDGHDL